MLLFDNLEFHITFKPEKMCNSNERIEEESYRNLSRVFRSNFFPSVEREWKSSTKETYTDYSTVNQQTAVINKQHIRRKDWLGKWHERDLHRLNVIRRSDEKYASRMKKGTLFYENLNYSFSLPFGVIFNLTK